MPVGYRDFFDFPEDDFLEELLLREEDFLPLVDEEEDFFLGTFPPALRASDKPIAIACFLLVTFLPDEPERRVPCFFSCIAFSTLSCAFFPYLAIISV